MEKTAVVAAVRTELQEVLNDTSIRTLVQLRSRVRKVFYRYGSQLWREIKNGGKEKC